MNENINLIKILKDVPEGTKLYSSIVGELLLYHINERGLFPIVCKNKNTLFHFTASGKYDVFGECILFPSKNQRDWSKFEIVKTTKNKFKPYDKVLVRLNGEWVPDLYRRPTSDGKHTVIGLNITYNNEDIKLYENDN